MTEIVSISILFYHIIYNEEFLYYIINYVIMYNAGLHIYIYRYLTITLL